MAPTRAKRPAKAERWFSRRSTMAGHGRHHPEPDPRPLGVDGVVEHDQPVGGGARPGYAARLERLVAGRGGRGPAALLRHGRHPEVAYGPAATAGGPDPQR